MTGDVVGTLRYMSPEQAGGNRAVLDHRADVYSLGVTLYELLTRQPAFTADDRHKLIHDILESEIRSPRQLNPVIPKDLETVVLTAVAKEPAGRYPTAQAMADDLTRFLEHKPIEARRPSAMDRVKKWSRRHRTVVRSAVLVLLVMVVGFGLSTFLVLRKHEEAIRHAAEARRQRDRAEANLRLAMSALGEMCAAIERSSEDEQLDVSVHFEN
jgi:hypothetical protein